MLEALKKAPNNWLFIARHTRVSCIDFRAVTRANNVFLSAMYITYIFNTQKINNLSTLTSGYINAFVSHIHNASCNTT